MSCLILTIDRLSKGLGDTPENKPGTYHHLQQSLEIYVVRRLTGIVLQRLSISLNKSQHRHLTMGTLHVGVNHP